MRLGIFGGTFDPPHIGHLIAAQDALLQLGLERVRFVPTSIPPHKQEGRAITPAAVRLALVHAAVSGDVRFEVDAIELERGGPSFTVDTLRLLRERDPHVALVLLIGADQYTEFETWREPDAIRQLARIAVLTRAGSPPPADGRIEHVAVTRIDVSSTEIRRRAGAGESIRYLVPAAVEALVRAEALYGTRP